MYECGTCWKGFPAGWHAREQHCRATGHCRPDFECEECGDGFDDEDGHWGHMVQYNHFEFECSQCGETWPTEQQRQEHERDEHLYCDECDRFFNNRNNLKMHLNSRKHRGQNIQCPFCKGTFTTATGMVHHVESSACPRAPNIGRDEIYKIIRAKDPKGVMSKKLLGWKEESNFQYEATEKSWNGWAYECYLCHRTFSTLHGINQHLSSPVHRQNLYHCPNRGCGSDFKTLAAVINHLESETCGAVKFEAVQKRIGDMVSGNRLIRF